MSLELKVIKGVSWMAFFNSFSQAFSWIITILIARILAPGDYGLMAMSTIITGYALSLSELGLGNAIIQRPHVTKDELSSIFWFLSALSFVLALSCFPVSYLTASIMHEVRVIPLTQTVAIVFILGGLQIVPSSLLRKEMDFKSLGFIDLLSTIISCIFMLTIAKFNGGVWTLLLGNIIQALVRTIMLFHKTKWRPSIHFNFNESKAYLSFGIMLAIGRSVFYVQEKSDRFFAGRAWKSQALGYYSFALDLSQIPTNKIVSMINNVSFPAFSKLQHDTVLFNKLYLNITKVTAAIVLPLFIGGFILGEDLIRLILNPKWFPMILLFRILCLSQILISLNAINNFVHAAQGRPNWALFYNCVSVVCMPVSFYFAVQKGLNFMAIPWLTTYLLLTTVWIFLTIRKLGIPNLIYFRNMLSPLTATSLMAFILFLLHSQGPHLKGAFTSFIGIAAYLTIGTISYCGYFWLWDRKFLLNLLNLFKRKQLEEKL